MVTRTWDGATADWNTDADWSPSTSGNDVPGPGDTAVIASGTVILTTDAAANDQKFENNLVNLGGAMGATLLLRNSQAAGLYYRVSIKGSATIEADGNRGFAGNVTGSPDDGSTITFKADPGGNLVFLSGGSFNVSDRTVDFEGNVTLERNAMVSSDIVNNGTLSILSGKTVFATNSLTGTGTIAIGSNAEFSLGGYQFSGASQTISFAGLGGQLDFSYQSTSYAGAIKNFAPGDFIRFTPGQGDVTSASLDTSAHTLSIADSGGDNYVFSNFYGAAGPLTVHQDSNGFDHIGYASAAPQLNYQIDAGSRAMHADVAHQMTIPGTGTPITGAGVKVGIISDSFNLKGGAAADVADGYLPASGVTVLKEGTAGSEDEGRAMAELIYQGAPGANLYFASTGSGVNDFASSVQALQGAGCTVIVDDIGFTRSEPFFQLGSPAENAISDALAHGVTCVTAVGNSGNPFYQHAFTTTAQTLADGSNVQAMTFSNGTPYQSITATGGLLDQIDLQWDAPFYGTGGVASDQPCSVSCKLFNATTNALVGTSTQVSVNGHLVAESELGIPYSSSTTTYNLAIYQNAGTPAVSLIKYILSGANGGPDVGGRINDPDAGVGSGEIEGHPLVPGEIAVGAMDVTNTSAFGRSPDFSDYFTSTGTGTLLFDANGNRLAQPITVGVPDVTGPDGIYTSVTGGGFTPFYGTSAAAPNVASVAALLQQVSPGISPASVATILAQSAIPLSGEPASIAGAGLVQADQAILLAEQTTCFASGTLIRTVRGDIAVEALAVGDGVVTASGAARQIKWIGRRSFDCGTHPDPTMVRPIRIQAGAFGGGKPYTDLTLSPHHAVAVIFLDEVLIPIRLLINGSSIVQIEDAGAVTYWHVELDSHDILVANGLPAESYIDVGNRCEFEGEGPLVLHPQFKSDALAAYCRPLVTGGSVLAAVRAQLAAQAAIEAIKPIAHFHLLVDGTLIAPVVKDHQAAFVVPADARDIRLVSPPWSPRDADPASLDHRRLGLMLQALTIDDLLGTITDIPLDDPALVAGFHPVERTAFGTWRWTDGDALIAAGLWSHCAGPSVLRIEGRFASDEAPNLAEAA